jgi:hypothetical protein
MSDLSEAFAEMNAERMGDAVRKNTRQNATPRMFPSSARVGRNESPEGELEDDDTPKQKHPPPAPLTPKMKVDLIMEHIKDLGSIHDLLHPEERSLIRQSIAPDTTSGVLYTRPMECMLSSSALCILVGIAIGTMMKTHTGLEQPYGFRSATTNQTTNQTQTPSSTSKRTVDRMLDYV